MSPCPEGRSADSYLSTVAENFSDTNTALPGILAPVGASVITAGATSQAWLGTNAATFGRWAWSGFAAIRVGPAVFTTLESAILVGASSGLNFAYAGVSFEAGALGGSLISAIPTDSGTVRDSIANALFDAFGPDNLADELRCGW